MYDFINLNSRFNHITDDVIKIKKTPVGQQYLDLMIRQEYDYLFKYILIGNTNVGKSCMLMRLLQNRFRSQHEPTLGVEFGSKMVTLKEKSIKLQIWDTAGQESFKSITRAYYKGSIAAVLVFDVTSEKSFEDLKNWLYQIKNHSHQKLSIVLVGNKKDLTSEREVSEEKAMNYAKENNFLAYFEVSALNGENVEKPFMEITQDIMSKIQSSQINPENTSGIKLGPKIKTKYPSMKPVPLKTPEKVQTPQNKCC